jgi:hypothetical protein
MGSFDRRGFFDSKMGMRFKKGFALKVLAALHPSFSLHLNSSHILSFLRVNQPDSEPKDVVTRE